jgi:hypothetical protein
MNTLSKSPEIQLCLNCGIEFYNPGFTICSLNCSQAFWEKKQGVLKLTGKENMSYLNAHGYQKSIIHPGRLEKIDIAK